MPLLDVSDIHTSYGNSHVLFGVSMSVNAGEVVGLLGRNGVGKSTILRSIMGLTPPTTGTVVFKGETVSGLTPHEINRRGVGFVPEDRRIFPELTVWENLDIGTRSSGEGEDWDLQKVFELFPDLEGIQDRKGGYLSGGQQQMLTIARTLMGNPELLLLDEPSEGLAPLVVENLRDQIQLLKQEGLSIILAEQSLNFVLTLSDRVYILEKGEVKYEGASEDIRANKDLIKRLLTV